MQTAGKGTALVALVLGVFAFAQANGIAWLSSYEEALRQAGENNKLVMIDFYTDW